MKKVLVLNADGQIARWVIEMLANNGEAEITLFLRHPAKIKRNAPKMRTSAPRLGDAMKLLGVLDPDFAVHADAAAAPEYRRTFTVRRPGRSKPSRLREVHA